MSYTRGLSSFGSLSFRRLSAIHALRIASPSLRTIHIQRQFSTTPRREASPSPQIDGFSAAALNSPLFKELASKPEVLQTMKDLMVVMKQEGINVDPANPPSMMKLLMNSRIRGQLMETWQVLQASGVDQQKLKDAFLLMKPKDS